MGTRSSIRSRYNDELGEMFAYDLEGRSSNGGTEALDGLIKLSRPVAGGLNSVTLT